MCNAWNHSFSCRCGFGGEGHLGSYSGYSRNLQPRPIILAGRIATRNGSEGISFLNPNARCPVCGAPVYFYQSPHGGRVFFDDVGWPWPKHPCTENALARVSTEPIQAIGDDINQLALFFVHEWFEQDFFPLICTRSDGARQVSADFLFNLENDRPKHISLFLAWGVYISKDTLFFIREIDARAGQYEVKFCYKEPNGNRVSTETMLARIDTLIRPVLRNGMIQFRDFTGVKVRPWSLRDSFLKAKKTPGDRGKKVARVVKEKAQNRKPSSPKCPYCNERLDVIADVKEHVLTCSRILEKCPFCLKSIPRGEYKEHIGFDCYRRKNRRS